MVAARPCWYEHILQQTGKKRDIGKGTHDSNDERSARAELGTNDEWRNRRKEGSASVMCAFLRCLLKYVISTSTFRWLVYTFSGSSWFCKFRIDVSFAIWYLIQYLNRECGVSEPHFVFAGMVRCVHVMGSEINSASPLACLRSCWQVLDCPNFTFAISLLLVWCSRISSQSGMSGQSFWAFLLIFWEYSRLSIYSGFNVHSTF